MNEQHIEAFSLWSLLRTARSIKGLRRRGRAAVDEAQREGLRRLLRHAHEEVPLYRHLWGRTAPEPEDLASLPVVTKAQLMENFGDGLAVRDLSLAEVKAFCADRRDLGALLRDRWVLSHTSGTTGVRGYFLSDPPSFATAMVCNGIAHAPFRKLPWIHVLHLLGLMRMRVAFVMATEGRFGDVFTARILERTGRVKTRLVNILDPPESVLRALAAFRPHVIHTYGGFAEPLARAVEDGRLSLTARDLSFSSEPIAAEALAALRRRLPLVRITERYTAAEAPHMARSCPFGRMHVSTHHLVLEAVDEANRPVPAGAWSDRALLTNLYNPVQPLIRYVLEDSIRLVEDPCPCGSPLPVVEIRGRSPVNVLLADEGGTLHSVSRTALYVSLLDVPGLRTYQFRRHGPRRLDLLHVADEDEAGPGLEDEIRRALAKQLGNCGLDAAFPLGLIRVASLPPNPHTGKMDRFVDPA